jgi:hypothetical protein
LVAHGGARSMNAGELWKMWSPKFMLPQSSDASSGCACTDARRSSSDMPGLPPVVKLTMTPGTSARLARVSSS